MLRKKQVSEYLKNSNPGTGLFFVLRFYSHLWGSTQSLWIIIREKKYYQVKKKKSLYFFDKKIYYYFYKLIVLWIQHHNCYLFSSSKSPGKVHIFILEIFGTIPVIKFSKSVLEYLVTHWKLFPEYSFLKNTHNTEGTLLERTPDLVIKTNQSYFSILSPFLSFSAEIPYYFDKQHFSMCVCFLPVKFM